jgi:hypothetical protein
LAAISMLFLSLAARSAGAAPATGSVTLSWTAPGDDGAVGRATAYSLRYSLAPITEANFGAAAQATGLPVPAPSGTTETFTVNGLVPNTTYFFAIKTRDEAFNWSAISNVVSLALPTTAAGDAPAALSFSEPWPNPARIGLRFALTLPEPAEVQVDAFSIAGRHVRRLAGGRWAAGPGDIAWDLRDDAGNQVAAGIYLVRARLGETLLTKRVVVIR